MAAAGARCSWYGVKGQAPRSQSTAPAPLGTCREPIASGSLRTDPQLRRGAAIAVGSPGRVLDHLSRGTLSLALQ